MLEKASARGAVDGRYGWRAKDSNPFKYVHDSEMYYRALRDWWSKKMPQRLFPEVEQEVSRLRLKCIQSQKHASLQSQKRVGPRAPARRGAVRAQRALGRERAQCGA